MGFNKEESPPTRHPATIPSLTSAIFTAPYDNTLNTRSYRTCRSQSLLLYLEKARLAKAEWDFNMSPHANDLAYKHIFNGAARAKIKR